VPLLLTGEGLALRDHGELADLAPTVLDLLGIPIPSVMTGRPLATPS
jgi:2,3-bisphosphoglycerate-independent phosphoglycerate mutase